MIATQLPHHRQAPVKQLVLERSKGKAVASVFLGRETHVDQRDERLPPPPAETSVQGDAHCSPSIPQNLHTESVIGLTHQPIAQWFLLVHVLEKRKKPNQNYSE
jgi:hypothetical protein